MFEQKPRIGKKGGAQEVAKKLRELRQKPISREIIQIVEESSESRKKQNKKVGRPIGDAEA